MLTPVYYTPDDTSQSSIFLYDTTLITDVATLLVPGRGIPDTVLSAAIYVVDACAHHRSKLSEVVSAIGANVNHGILISLFRDTVRRLTANEDVLYEVIDGLMGIVSYVATSPPHSNQIIGAGIIPLLLDIPKTQVEKRVNVSLAWTPHLLDADSQYVARTMGLIDAVIYSAPQGLTAFSNADGINVLVKTIKVSLIIRPARTVLTIGRDRDFACQYSTGTNLRAL
jgi:E3 ubiquitin-protein ligase HUWE1